MDDIDRLTMMMSSRIMENQKAQQAKVAGIKKKVMCPYCKIKKQEKEKAQARDRNLNINQKIYKSMI